MLREQEVNKSSEAHVAGKIVGMERSVFFTREFNSVTMLFKYNDVIDEQNPRIS